ncbi:hypothetical protein L596_010269 [Steinernema carpocapsae]|uniref:Uncharacterized protein n=1 Tax=Steinernema carpocapsae TaxID=34508 RepID=A0A4U5PHU8_STECR|nr:hypothetical protein L596_010269 [Steinernema carpocapsae]
MNCRRQEAWKTCPQLVTLTGVLGFMRQSEQIEQVAKDEVDIVNYGKHVKNSLLWIFRVPSTSFLLDATAAFSKSKISFFQRPDGSISDFDLRLALRLLERSRRVEQF